MNKEAPLDKQDKAEINNYTRTPNMLIFGYHDTLSPQEKWLYVCLKHLCGKRGTRHLSLRYISEQTGISTGALSKSKHSEGMIRHLHDAGLIHAEIKKPGKGNPQYHITITDVWGLNQSFFSKRSEFGQDEEENSEPVRNSDEPVQNSDRSVHVSDEPVRNSANTNIRDKTNYKITEQEESASAPAHFSEQEQTNLLKLGIQIAEERVDDAIEDVDALQAEQLSGSHPAYTKGRYGGIETHEQHPPVAPSRPTDDAGGTRVKGPDRSRASGRRGKAQQENGTQVKRRAEIKALYAELLGFEPVWNRDEADGLKTLAQSPIATDEAIRVTYSKYKKDKFWGPQLTLKVIAKFLNATVGSSNARTILKKPQARPTVEEIDKTIFCVDPTWRVYQRPGDDQEWILWEGELCTPDEAEDRGYAGGGGLYIQTDYSKLGV